MIRSGENRKVAKEFLLLRNFNRRFTIRRLEQFGNPVPAAMDKLELPLNSIMHFIPEESTVWGPSQSSEFFNKSAPGGARVRSITEYLGTDTIGRPKRIDTGVNKELNKLHRLNPRFRKWHEGTDEKAIGKNSRILLIDNYAPLLPIYKYPSKVMSWYERWYNTFSTITTVLKENVKEFDRQNYIFIDIPDVIPSINELKRAEIKRDVNTLKNMRKSNVLYFLELWSWVGNNRDKSMLDNFTAGEYRRINFILRNNGYFICINLGELDFWRKTKDGSGRITPEQMQRRLYKTYADFAKNIPLGQEEAYDGMRTNDDENFSTDFKSISDVVRDTDMDIDEYLLKTQGQGGTLHNNHDELEDIESLIKDFDTEFNIDEDEAIVVSPEGLAKAQIKEVDFSKPITPQDGILRACDRYIDSGLMTSKEYQYYKDNADNYLHIPNPYGNGTIGENLKVTTDDLKIDREELIPNSPIIDATDGGNVSSMTNFHSKYINEVLPKDMLNAVTMFQRGGFLIKDYSIEKIVDATGASLVHYIKVQAVGGGETVTLPIETPIFDNEGYWTTNNVKYTLRNQCVDMPIRKTSYDTVALTSGYGKNFIHRSSLAVADYYRWLNNKIVAIGSDNNNYAITGLVCANRFDRSVKLPRDYTGISMRIAKFTAGDIVYTFDYKQAKTLYPDFDELAKENLVPIGKSSNATYVMGMDNIVYKKDKKGISSVGKIHEMLNIDTSKAPKEFSNISIMRKDVPLAILLCYYYGMQGLFKHLGVNYQIVDRNKRASVKDYDFIIKTATDKILINYENDEQRLLINGLNPYLSLISEVSTKEMDLPGTYQFLIQKNGLTQRYIQELDNMNNLFIDNITQRELHKMGEPEIWTELLLRANQLLTLDYHNEESDFNEMHIFTHQRMAMALNTEIIRAIRDYHNKPGRNKRIEMSRNCVMNAISEDGSVLLAADVSPMQSMREKYVVTKGGTGGRSRRSMVKHTRRFTESDIGVVSNDTVDSGDVAITYFLADDPKLASLDGEKDKTFKIKDLKTSSYLSAAEMTHPFAFNEDRHSCPLHM